MEIKIQKRIMGANEDKARQIRTLLAEKNVLMLNLISSPGSGKTSLLEKTLQDLQGKYTIAVIEGDVATDKDARRLEGFGVPIVLINTAGGCHLSSPTIEKALSQLDLDLIDLILIENVGNLVCPSGFDLGEYAKVAVVSTAEGDDKPSKYPMLFRHAELVILNKIDLLPYVNFDREQFYQDVKHLHATIPILETSCTTGQGIEGWHEWLAKMMEESAAS